MQNKKHTLYYHALLLPGIIMLIIFNVIPMGGLIMAFQNYQPARGILRSAFVGMDNFTKLFLFPNSKQVIFNTMWISLWKIIYNLIISVLFALILNECASKFFKKFVQTAVYLPYFLSWVIVAVMLSNFFSLNGIVNRIVVSLGAPEPILFLASNDWFRTVLVASDVWKGFGYGSIIFLAAITNLDPTHYEAADIDGATRLQKIRFITFPGILPTVILISTLSLGRILNAGFDQVFNMYSPLVYRTGDIIDTYVYRVGLEGLQYSFGTAVGFFKSLVSLVLIAVSYYLADRYAGYTIF